MAILNILHFPDPRLRIKALPVETFDEKIQQLIDDMFETMYQAPGIGLAATQVNLARRIIVIDLSEDKQQPLCLINPVILSCEGRSETEEGCLSVPSIHEKVKRSATIQIQALDRYGQKIALTAEGLLSTCIQHEMDHLEGRLFIDHLSEIKRQRVRKQLEQQPKKGENA